MGAKSQESRPSPPAGQCVLDGTQGRTRPTGGVYQLVFDDGRGLITYLLLTDRERVDVLLVTWVSIDDFGADRR